MGEIEKEIERQRDRNKEREIYSWREGERARDEERNTREIEMRRDRIESDNKRIYSNTVFCVIVVWYRTSIYIYASCIPSLVHPRLFSYILKHILRITPPSGTYYLPPSVSLMKISQKLNKSSVWLSEIRISSVSTLMLAVCCY